MPRRTLRSTQDRIERMRSMRAACLDMRLKPTPYEDICTSDVETAAQRRLCSQPLGFTQVTSR